MAKRGYKANTAAVLPRKNIDELTLWICVSELLREQTEDRYGLLPLMILLIIVFAILIMIQSWTFQEAKSSCNHLDSEVRSRLRPLVFVHVL